MTSMQSISFSAFGLEKKESKRDLYTGAGRKVFSFFLLFFSPLEERKKGGEEGQNLEKRGEQTFFFFVFFAIDRNALAVWSNHLYALIPLACPGSPVLIFYRLFYLLLIRSNHIASKIYWSIEQSFR